MLPTKRKFDLCYLIGVGEHGSCPFSTCTNFYWVLKITQSPSILGIPKGKYKGRYIGWPNYGFKNLKDIPRNGICSVLVDWVTDTPDADCIVKSWDSAHLLRITICYKPNT